MKSVIPLLLAGLLFCLCGCGGPDQAFRPIDPDAAVFWDRQTTENAALLREIIDEFNAQYGGLPIKIERAGSYADIFRKVSASIQARTLPAMAVSYESMTCEYVPTGALLALDGLIHDPDLGLSEEELADFFPVVIETNTFHEFGGKMYSLPFAKSVLMMFYNRRVLGQAGIETPPHTWGEFLDQCRRVKAKTGKYAYAIHVDCSTIDGMIYSMGGGIIRGRETLFDSPESIRVFELLETLVKEGLAYQINPGTYDDNLALAKGDIAFCLRTSASRTGIAIMMESDHAGWGMAQIPQVDPQHPATVLYGPNISIFNTTPEQRRAAFAFVKYFTSPETSVRWAAGTGYLPIRKAKSGHPGMQQFWAGHPHSRAAYDCMAFARPEPNIAGWQQVRDLVDRAQTEVLTKTKTGRQAALDLKTAADRVLARH